MKKRFILFFMSLLAISGVSSAEGFKVKGVLPWHNFLCGPSAWNIEDYEEYLDKCAQNGINFIGFHNYTGGAERYATYVEPMIKIEYENIVPHAFFDNSSTSRWGALPIEKEDFAYGSDKYVDFTKGKFGSKSSILAGSDEERYESAHELMSKVLQMAHERGIKMAIGFEFGIIPPEYFSLYSPSGRFFWLSEAGMIPDPCDPTAIAIHFAAVDDLLDSYKDIDYIWLWLSEHSFMEGNLDDILRDERFNNLFKENEKYFSTNSSQGKFLGVWSLEYIRLTLRRLKEKGSNAKVIIGGWGGGSQLPTILQGLDKALPSDVIFSCLNPDLGKASQADFFADIARNREVWTIPWLEGDNQLWHWQPRVSLMKNQVRKAYDQGVQGVLCIHWRTWENRYNFKAFSQTADNPESDRSVEEDYIEYFSEDFGAPAAKIIAPVFAKIDESQIWKDISSPEYFAYNPYWGRLNKADLDSRKELLAAINKAEAVTGDGLQKENLLKFKSVFEFEILLDECGRKMEKAWKIREASLATGEIPDASEYEAALSDLESAPIKEMLDAFEKRVDNRGDMGILVSINQRLWQNWLMLRDFCNSALSD